MTLHVVSCPKCPEVSTTPCPDEAVDRHFERTGHEADSAPLCEVCRECPASRCDYCGETSHCIHTECFPPLCLSAYGREMRDEAATEAAMDGRWT